MGTLLKRRSIGAMLLKMGRHPFRPAHVHTMIQRAGFAPLTTHLFVAGDEYLGSDAVFGVKDSLIVDFVRHPPGKAPDGSTMNEPFSTASYDFVLARAYPAGSRPCPPARSAPVRNPFSN